MMTPLTTDAVLIDLDGTLLGLDFDRFLPRYVARLCRFYREAAGVDILAPAMAAATLMLANDGRGTNADVFWTAAAGALGADRGMLERVYADFVAAEGPLLGEGIAPDPSARALVEACRASGWRVALATNPIFPRCMIAERARWAGLDLELFDVVSSSETMRFCKPRREYVRDVAAELGAHPARCWMVGNDVALDLVPAAAIGMRTCLVQSELTIHADADFVPDETCALAEIPLILGRAIGSG